MATPTACTRRGAYCSHRADGVKGRVAETGIAHMHHAPPTSDPMPTNIDVLASDRLVERKLSAMSVRALHSLVNDD